MRRSISWLGTGLVMALVAGVAQPAAAIDFGRNDGAEVELGAGAFDVLHHNTAGLFRGEYEFGTNFWLLRPFVGVEVSTDGSAYGYGGFGMDIYLNDAWVLTPNVAVGAWTRGDGKELGSTVEFRSGAEIDYQFTDHSRLGLTFHHISNAGIGKHNPGEEEALAVYRLPLTLP